MSGDVQAGLFDPDPEDAARPVGTIEGPARWDKGFGAGLRVWCGPEAGWRDLGDFIGSSVSQEAGTVVFHRTRLRVTLSFDLGPHTVRRPRALDDPDDPTTPEDDDHGPA